MAQVKIGSGGVEAGLDTHRASGFFGLGQARAQLFLADEFRQSFPEVLQLFVDGHVTSIKAGDVAEPLERLRCATAQEKNERDSVRLSKNWRYPI